MKDIIKRLRAGKYGNEEQVRFSLVAWHYTLKGSTPSIVREMKLPGKLNNPNELRKAATQLKVYNANLTAFFTVQPTQELMPWQKAL